MASTYRYRNDFNGDARTCIHYCLQFLNETTRSLLLEILDNNSGLVTVKYEQSCDNRFYANLKPKE